jgi:hypothetical protein
VHLQTFCCDFTVKPLVSIASAELACGLKDWLKGTCQCITRVVSYHSKSLLWIETETLNPSVGIADSTSIVSQKVKLERLIIGVFNSEACSLPSKSKSG